MEAEGSSVAKIKVLVDDFSESAARGILPREPLAGYAKKIIDVSVDHLSESIAASVTAILSGLSGSNLRSPEFEVDEIRFTLNISASGSVSLLAAATGNLTQSTGLEFTIRRRSS
jgi:hypothetical protein